MSENSQVEKIDLRGLTCPTPVIKTKKLFDKPETKNVEALVDDEVCVNNLQRLARSLKANCNVKKEKDYYSVILQRALPGSTDANLSETPSANMPTPGHTHASVSSRTERDQQQAGGTGTVLFLAKDQFGEGDQEFSKTLMNLFLQTTFESGLRPRAILMANTGVRLMAPDAQTLKVLNDFRDAGCEVLACGLCVEFYGLKGQIPTQQITSMFAICEFLFAADRIVQP